MTHPVDTGFLVYNDRTYPNLVKLFAALGVESANSEMSFSVRIGDGALEWSGSNLATVFAQPANLVNPRFLRMLSDLLRFNREASRLARGGGPVTGTLGEFLDAGGYGREVRELYLIPMAACIWSTPATQINRFPLATFLHFCANHGLLAVSNRPQWRTVKGGAREYVRKLVAALPDVRLATPVHQVRRLADRVELATDLGTQAFDQVVLATHTDQSLALLEQPSVEERAVFKAIPYQSNRAVLHTDERLLPRRRRAWASWNFHAPKPELSDEPVCLTYLINRLQPLPFASPVMVTMNPVEAPRDDRVLASFEYHHPVFLEGSDEAKRRVVGAAGPQPHLVLRRVDAQRLPRGRARLRRERRAADGRPHPLDRMNGPRILFGRVFHCRRRPARHAFAYPVFFLRVPLAGLADAGRGIFSVDRWNLLSLHDAATTGRATAPPSSPGCARSSRRPACAGADGEILLQAFPRVLGYVFNPIAIFYCHDRAGALRAVLCEVSNTFGERHNYLLAHADGRAIGPRDWLRRRQGVPRLALLRGGGLLPLPLRRRRGRASSRRSTTTTATASSS